MIFCSHVIEHIPDTAAKQLFRESFRALRYGGVLRLSCPDANKALANYHAGNADPKNEVVSKAARNAEQHLRLLNVFASFKADSYQNITNTKQGTYAGGPIVAQEKVDAMLHASGPEEFGKWCVSMIPPNATYLGHINCYTADKLIGMLHEAGFPEVALSKFRGSSRKELRGPGFDTRPNLSLFVEARAMNRSKRIFNLASKIRNRARRTLQSLS